MKIEAKKLKLNFDEKTLSFSVWADGALWRGKPGFRPYFRMENGRDCFFDEASLQWCRPVTNGVGSGFLSHFENFPQAAGLAFETFVWLEEAEGDVRFEWIPLSDGGAKIRRLFWPGPAEFDCKSRSWYTLLGAGQGILLPNDWPKAQNRLPFDGRFLTHGSYMPWFGQIKEGSGLLAIAETPWNGGVWIDHPENGPCTDAGVWWEPDLGEMRYRRILRCSFFEQSDYNELCKAYRSYVRENGKLVTLREKKERNPKLPCLVGAEFVHFGIKTSTNPASGFYQPGHPEKNSRLVTFAEREELIKELCAQGAGKMYLHLDGWAQPGYDNRHPDFFPACAEAGGWEGMRRLADTMHCLGGAFGIHDQYRDYYHDAPSYSEEYAVRRPDGTYDTHARWAGGPQSYLCGSQALYYVKRNFRRIFENQIPLDGAYLDVFTCNEGDECANLRHRMSRRECYEYRRQCLAWLTANGILPSSEEVSDWSMDTLVFCHYAPYLFMLDPPGTPKDGIPVPLFNLVYHDCVIEPWMMEKYPGEDYMLYALLNGGAPYLVRLGAYDGTDGAFGGGQTEPAEHIRRCHTVSSLHEKVAFCELLRHSLLDENGLRQESVFADGTRVEADFTDGSWRILHSEKGNF